MIYAKFSRRHIAGALFFFVATVLIVGAVFLIFLFNAKSDLIVELRHDVVHNIQKVIGVTNLQNSSHFKYIAANEAESPHKTWSERNKSIVENATIILPHKYVNSDSSEQQSRQRFKKFNAKPTDLTTSASPEFTDYKSQSNKHKLNRSFDDQLSSDSTEPDDTIYIDDFENVNTPIRLQQTVNVKRNRYTAQNIFSKPKQSKTDRSSLSKTLIYNTYNNGENLQITANNSNSRTIYDERDDDDDEELLETGSGSGDYENLHFLITNESDKADELSNLRENPNPNLSKNMRRFKQPNKGFSKIKRKSKDKKYLRNEPKPATIAYGGELSLKISKLGVALPKDNSEFDKTSQADTTRGRYSLRSNKTDPNQSKGNRKVLANGMETKTRRVMGNFKRSEERSRQLLLCEKKGDGELCRMLFKDNAND